MAKPGVTEFSTRWELVADLLNELSQLNFSISIAEVPMDADIVLDELREQGIDVTNEHECYVFVMGMCNLVEALLTSHQHGNVPRDELMGAVSRMLGILSFIRNYLPQDIFVRYLL